MCIKYICILLLHTIIVFLSTIFDLITYLDACPRENGFSVSPSGYQSYTVLHLGVNSLWYFPIYVFMSTGVAIMRGLFTCGNIVEILLAQLRYLYGRHCPSADALVFQLFLIPPSLCYCLKVRCRAFNRDVSFGDGNPAVYCSLHAVLCESLLIVSLCVRRNHFWWWIISTLTCENNRIYFYKIVEI